MDLYKLRSDWLNSSLTGEDQRVTVNAKLNMNQQYVLTNKNCILGETRSIPSRFSCDVYFFRTKVSVNSAGPDIIISCRMIS